MHADDDADDTTLEDGTPVRLAVQCRRCHGWMTSPASVAERIGPVCARHERAASRRAERLAEPGLFDIADPSTPPT
ncbi:DUF6011 domain-containing protein [Nocardia salmonicida]|uniref:DUF6011 domain-containing protein n=1 Tax=Nocardia salmonicida TaxID=53431 RepID=UPI002E2A9F8F|nr:DUF6011 domain-containing protein [Nocardia salmonicida]